VVRREVAGWVMLHFRQGIQHNFKAINLELLPSFKVPVLGEVMPDASMDWTRKKHLMKCNIVWCH